MNVLSRVFVILTLFILSLQNVFACELERKVSKITFVTDVGLSHKDLSRNLSLSIGDICTKDKIQQSIKDIKRRDIFENIEFKEFDESDGIHAQFLLIPYLVLSRVEFVGNRELSNLILRRSLSIRQGEKIGSSQLDIIRDRLIKTYNDSGFFDVDLKIQLQAESTSPLTRVIVEISEGKPRRVGELIIEEGDVTLLKEIIREIQSYARDKVITRDALREIRRFALREFRDRGFYQARVSLEHGPISSDGRQDIIIRINQRERIRFDVIGNSHFSDNEILAPLRLEQRNVPLQRTALDSLCPDIRDKYQEAGFLKVSVECERLSEEDPEYEGDRDIFNIVVDEGVFYKVRSVSFSGNTIISTEELKKIINVVPRSFISGIFSASQLTPTDSILRADISRIKDAYKLKGITTVEIRTRIKVDDERRTVGVRYQIREEGTNLIEKIQFIVDYPETRDQEVVDLCRKWEDDFSLLSYDQNEIEDELNILQERLYELGYPESTISSNYQNEESLLQLVLSLGPKVVVGKLILAGNFYTHDRIIKRELSLKEGDPWNPLILDDSRQALYSLGIFRSVTIEPEGGDFEGGTQNLKTKVLERETGTVQGLVEISTQDGLHIQTQVGQRNLFGDARALVLALDGYFKGTDGPLDAARTRLAYGSPRIFNSSLDYGLEAFYQTALELNDSFKLDRFGLTNNIRYPFMKALRVTGSHTIYSERLFDVDSKTILGPRDFGTTVYSGFRASIEYDRRDDVFNPTKGYRFELGAGYFPGWAGSQVRMLELNAQETTIIPLGNGFTYAFNVRGSLLETLDENEVVPLGSRYFIGGRETLRGYTRFQVGPRAQEDGLVVGGDTLGVFSQELRYSFTDSVLGLIFLDVGQSFLRNEGDFTGDTKARFKDLRFSPGFGTQYITPIGPLSAELGFATDREFGERWGRFLISIGSAF